MVFEWDEEKNRSNLKKHGIDFRTAARVFQDDDRIEIYDEKHSSKNEDRYITIGIVNKLLYVVYTDRRDAIRLISARVATKEERAWYYD